MGDFNLDEIKLTSITQEELERIAGKFFREDEGTDFTPCSNLCSGSPLDYSKNC